MLLHRNELSKEQGIAMMLSREESLRLHAWKTALQGTRMATDSSEPYDAILLSTLTSKTPGTGSQPFVGPAMVKSKKLDLLSFAATWNYLDVR